MPETKQAYVVRNVDGDYEYVYAIVAKSPSQAKTIGMSFLECEYCDVRYNRHKDVDVSHLAVGEIEMFWALKKGLYGWVNDKCPQCGYDSYDNRVYYDNGFYCANCEDINHNKESI